MGNRRHQLPDDRPEPDLMPRRNPPTSEMSLLLDGVPVPTCYRYRTSVLVGPWRLRSNEAEQDAIRARQARRDSAGEFRWSVDGTIEAADPADAAEDLRGWSAH